jgi:hypothetical protein
MRFPASKSQAQVYNRNNMAESSTASTQEYEITEVNLQTIIIFFVFCH